MLRTHPFYVCPGPHRSQSLNPTCGGKADFFCKSWGCETSGTARWKPSSSWDYIRVTANYSLASYVPGGFDLDECTDWCHPLRVTFTEPGKRALGWTKGYTWGLRIYKERYDEGLLFTIRLKIETPYNPLGPPTKFTPLTHTITQPTPVIADPLNMAAITQPPTPQVPLTITPEIPSRQRMFNLVRGAFYALNRTDPSATEDCWLCLSSGPPYYEGIAFNGDFNRTSSHTSCSWGTGQKLTLTEVSARNPGLCIGTPPSTHKHLCGQIQSVSRTEANYYLVPSPVGWWACNTGLTPCVSTKVFNSSHDFCVMIQLLPRVYYHPASSLEESYAGRRSKREPITLTLAAFMGIGMAVGVGTGVSALIEGRQGIQSLRDAVNEDLAPIEKSIDALEKSLTSLSEVVLQNRRGLDLLFLKEGGLCAALKEECCFYADHTGIVRDSMQKLRERLERRKRERDVQRGWFESWFESRPSWITSLISAVAGPILMICLALVFGPCIINRGMAFIQSKIDTVKLMVLQRQYQPIVQVDEELGDTNL